jgi:hypothetical protein
MTEAPVSTRRRCSQCGRFLAAGSTEKLCTLCIDAGANGSEPELSAISARQASEPPPPFEGAVRPAPGVVIPRPSQLHPDEEHPVPKKLPPVRPPIASPAPSPTTTPAPKAARKAKPARAPVRQVERAETDAIRERRIISVEWVRRLIVGLAIGLLVGIAVPLLLSR